MRTFLSVLGAALAIALAGCAPEPPIKDQASVAVAAQRIAVVAGDRLIVDGRPVRRADAATPQPDAHCAGEVAAAQRTADAVRAIVAEARDVQVDSRPEDMGLVHLDGLDLGLTLISQGLATPRGTPHRDWCDDGLRQAQAQPRAVG